MIQNTTAAVAAPPPIHMQINYIWHRIILLFVFLCEFISFVFHYTWTSSLAHVLNLKRVLFVRRKKKEKERRNTCITTTVPQIHAHKPTLTLASQSHSKREVAIAYEQVHKSGQFSVSAFRVQTIQNTLWSSKKRRKNYFVFRRRSSEKIRKEIIYQIISFQMICEVSKSKGAKEKKSNCC